MVLFRAPPVGVAFGRGVVGALVAGRRLFGAAAGADAEGAAATTGAATLGACGAWTELESAAPAALAEPAAVVASTSGDRVELD
ncbi:MAG: hypothetical protein ABI134_13890, partial [Byssovorax sp.]